MVEHAEVGPAGVALHAADGVRIIERLDQREALRQIFGGGGHDRLAMGASGLSRASRSRTERALAILADTMARAKAAVRAGSSASRYCWRRSRTLPGVKPAAQGQKASMHGEERHGHIPLAAQAQQGRAYPDAAEADDPAQGMNRDPQAQSDLSARTKTASRSRAR